MRNERTRELSFGIRSTALAMAGLVLLVATGIRASAAPPSPLDVSGVWDLTVETQTSTAHTSVTLKQEGEKLTGTYHGRMGDTRLEGTLKEDNIRFTVTLKFQDASIVVTYEGTVSGDTMKGTARFGDAGTGKWSAKKK